MDDVIILHIMDHMNRRGRSLQCTIALFFTGNADCVRRTAADGVTASVNNFFANNYVCLYEFR